MCANAFADNIDSADHVRYFRTKLHKVRSNRSRKIDWKKRRKKEVH